MRNLICLLGMVLLTILLSNPVLSEEEITVSAAISLKNAFTDIGKLYEEGHPGGKINFNFGASGDLIKQIQGGAPVAVFASAARKDMDILEQEGLIVPGSRADLAENEVVLVQPKQTMVKLSGFLDLAKPEVKKIAIGNPKTVPAGRYAMEVCNYFKIAEAIQERLILAENVRQVLDYVARGEVDAGLVYHTDAMTRPQEVQVIAAAPPDSHKAIVYPIALIKGAANDATAQGFVAFVLSNQGQAVLQKYGFRPVPNKKP
jgi:molybdate transport system substrate-binding protein